jgi:chemotaxis protein histidine kinase CheA
LVLVAFVSIPATALRQAIDPSFKSEHLQVQLDFKAAADKAAADKAAADKAAADKAAADKAAADKAAADKATADKAAADKATADKAAKPKSTVSSTNSEKLGGFSAAHIRSFKTIVSNIKAYVTALNAGSTIRASQICDLLDDNYNGSVRGVYSSSSMQGIQDLLDNAKDAMYMGVTDCTRGFRKNRVDLIGESVSEFVLASKYFDGLVLVSQVK